MEDYKDTIIKELTIIKNKEYHEGNIFKVKAYDKIIRQLNDKTQVRGMNDLDDVKGIGKSIRGRIEEIIEYGRLKELDDIRSNKTNEVVENFRNIYGIGPVKAKYLTKDLGIKSIKELKEKLESDPSILNKKQKIGLDYYDDLLERIPRKEMKIHSKKVKKYIKEVSSDLQVDIVGSYRRGAETSGDIDVLVKWPSKLSVNEGKETLQKIVENMIKEGYLIEILAKGDKKMMGISRLDNGKARRIDILLTPENEYGYALLYFTGSDKFNVILRKLALDKGFSMNEHGLISKEDEKIIPALLTEEEIFNFFGLKIVKPENRNEKVSLEEYYL
jgi:DNA polymerase/3'-5' exonuclease PolX